MLGLTSFQLYIFIEQIFTKGLIRSRTFPPILSCSLLSASAFGAHLVAKLGAQVLALDPRGPGRALHLVSHGESGHTTALSLVIGPGQGLQVRKVEGLPLLTGFQEVVGFLRKDVIDLELRELLGRPQLSLEVSDAFSRRAAREL